MTKSYRSGKFLEKNNMYSNDTILMIKKNSVGGGVFCSNGAAATVSLRYIVQRQTLS